MEDLLENISPYNEQALHDVHSYLMNNPLSQQNPTHIKRLINKLLSHSTFPQIKLPILYHIIDCFISQKFTSDMLSKLSIENIFKQNNPLYITNSNVDDVVEKFFNYIFPNNNNVIVNELNAQMQIPIDLLWDFEKEKGWFRGTLTKEPNNNKYIINSDVIYTEIDNINYKIQPAGCVINDYEWRCNLNEGDEIDFLDNSDVWYIATIIERNGDIVKVGIRRYLPNGMNVDENGKFFGWKKEFDVICKVYDSRIQKPFTYSKRIEDYYQSTYSVEAEGYNSFQAICPRYIKDEHGKERLCSYIIPKTNGTNEDNAYNLTYIQLCNYFFTKLNPGKIINEDNDDRLLALCSSLDMFEYFLVISDIFACTYKNMHLIFAKKVLMVYQKLAEEVLFGFSNVEKREFKLTRIVDILTKMFNIHKLIFFEHDAASHFADFMLEFGFNCFKNSTILEKRLLGLTALKTGENYTLKADKPEKLLFLLNIQPNIFDLVYAGKCHSELVQKSDELMKHLFKFKLISQEHIEQLSTLLINNANENEEISKALCHVLSYAQYLDITLIKRVIDVVINYSKTPQKETAETIMTLIQEAPKENFRELSEPLLDWELEYFLTPLNVVSPLIAKVIEATFSKLLAVPWGGNDLKYFYKKYLNIITEKLCYENIKNSLVLLRTLDQPGFKSQDEKNAIYDIMIIKHKVFDKLITYLKEGKYNSVFFNVFNFVLENTTQIQNISEYIKTLFEIFIPCDGMLNKYNKDFIIWLKKLQEKSIIKSNQIEFAFDYVKQCKTMLSPEMCEFYWNLFLEVNNLLTTSYITVSQENGLEKQYIETENGKKLYSISNDVGSSSSRNNTEQNKKEIKNAIQIYRDNPQYNVFKLKYFELIWEMLIIKAPPKYCGSSKLFSLFLDDYTDISIQHEYWNEVISRCIAVLNQSDVVVNKVNNDDDNEVDDEGEVMLSKKSALNLLDSLISFSEIKGTACVKSYKSFISKNNEMSLEFINKINPKPNLENFTLNLNSTMTIWELKKELSHKLELAPEFIALTYQDKDIPNTQHGVTINDEFKSQNKITLSKVSKLESIPKVPLIKDKQFTPKAKQVFAEIFDMFKQPNNLMSKEGCTGFTKVVLGLTDISIDNPHVTDLFNRYDYDKDGFVTLEDFSQFFIDAIVLENKATTVWDNIKSFGYRNDLNKLNEPLDNSIKDDDYELMPRYVLGNNQEWFNVLLKHQRSNNEKVASKAKRLIQKIAVNKQILHSILNQDESFKQILINKDNSLLFNYNLELIATCVDDNKNEECFSKWREEFLIGDLFISLIKNNLLVIDTSVKDSEIFKSVFYLLDIIISGLTKVFHYEQYKKWFTYKTANQFYNDETIINNNDNIIPVIDTDKYYLNDLLMFTYNIINTAMTIEQNVNDDLRYASYDVINKALNLFTLITIYQNGKFFLNDNSFNISCDDVNKFISKGLVETTHFIIGSYFKLMFFCLIKAFKSNVNDDCIKFISFLKEFLKKYILDSTYVKCIKPLNCFSIYTFMLNEKLFNESEAITIINSIIEISFNANTFHNYFNIVDGLLNLISDEHKVTICNEKNILNELINKYLLQNINEEKVSNETEKMIFTIISQFIMSDSHILVSFFENPKIQNIKHYLTELPDKKENYKPSLETKSSLLCLGIQNLKFICYMISILQQFYNQKTFTKGIITARDNENYFQLGNDDNLLHQLQRMFTYLQLSNRSSFNPKDFVYSFKDYDGQPTDINVQCDAQEFLSRFMDKIEYSLKPTLYKFLMKNIFLGETCSQLICKNGCGSIRNRFEDLAFLSLDIKNMDNLDQCLQKYISEEIIDDFMCDKCNKKTQHIKRISLNKLPNVLLIHLQRMSLNYETFETVKINSQLSYRLEINLKEYSTEELNKKKYTVTNDSGQFEDFNNKVYEHIDDYYKYEIKGIVVHSGTAQFGHYYSILKINKNDLHYNWVKCNDERVSCFLLNKLPQETFGVDDKRNGDTNNTNEWDTSEQSKSAYMLVYERVKKSPLFIKETQNENVNVNDIKPIDNFDKFMKDIDPFNKAKEEENKIYLDSEIDALSRNEKEIAKILNDEPIINDDNSSKVLYKYKDDIFKIENYYTNYKDPPFYTPEYYKEVLNDNIIFRNDKSIYNEGFCMLIHSVIEKITLNHNDYSDTQIISIFNKINEIVLTFLVRSSLKKEVNDIVKALTSLLKTKTFLSKQVLDLFLQNKQKWMFNLIVTNEDQFNICFTDYLVNAIILAFEQDDIKEIAINTMEYIYSLMPLEMSQNWTKMGCYLEIFDKLASSKNKNVVDYLFEKQTISKLGDFFLGKESPFLLKNERRNEMGTKLYAAKFAPLISAISKLSRMCDNFKGKNYAKQKQKLSQQNEQQQQPEEQQQDQNNNNNQIELDHVYTLSQHDSIILNNINFYKKAIKGNYDQTALSKLIYHYMYEDIDYTNMLYYPLIDFISNPGDNNIKEVFNLLCSILVLEDSITFERFNVLLGYPKITFTNSKSLTSSNSLPSISFVSSLFPNKDTLLSNMITKYKSLADYIVVISYLYAVVFNAPSLMRYYSSLPHPENNGESYNDLIIKNAKKEIDTISNLNIDKFAQSISKVNFAIEKYQEKQNEMKEIYKNNINNNNGDEWEITFLPKNYRLGKTIQETIKDIPIETANSDKIYLIQSDMVIELEQTNQIDLGNNDNASNANTTNVNNKDNKELKLFSEKIKYNPNEEEKSNSEKQHSSNDNFYLNLYKKVDDVGEERKMVSDIDNYIEMKRERESKGILLTEKEIIRKFNKHNTIDIQRANEIHTTNEEEEKRASPTHNEIDNEQQSENTNAAGTKENDLNIKNNTITIRSFIIVNTNKTKSFQTLLKINHTHLTKCYYPNNIMNFVNANSTINAFSLYLPENELNLCEVSEFLIQECDMSKIEMFSEQFEINRTFKRSKSFEENAFNELKEGLEGKTTTETIDPNISITINNEENGFEMICQSCGASNWINSTHNYICNNCSFSLL